MIVRRAPPAILIISAKHLIHGIVLTLTADADRVMNTWVLFVVFLQERVLVVSALLFAAILPLSLPFRKRMPAWGILLVLAPQQTLLIMSCFGAIMAVVNGRTPSGRVVASVFLFQDQLSLFVLAIIHFWSMVTFVRKERR